MLQLVLERLRIDTHSAVTYYLLASARGDGTVTPRNTTDELADTLKPRVKWQQIVLQVYDLHVWLWQRAALLLMKCPLICHVLILVESSAQSVARSRYSRLNCRLGDYRVVLLLATDTSAITIVDWLGQRVGHGGGRRRRLVPQHHGLKAWLLLGRIGGGEALAEGLQWELVAG